MGIPIHILFTFFTVYLSNNLLILSFQFNLDNQSRYYFEKYHNYVSYVFAITLTPQGVIVLLYGTSR